MNAGPWTIRRAGRADADGIAAAHRDSIQSLGPGFYPATAVADWQAGIGPELYLRAMDGGEVFFIAVAALDGRETVLGFASDYRIEGTTHGASAYVRGSVARRGVGSTLLATAEAHAREQGATEIRLESSLPGVEFYRARGFVEVGRGDVALTTGRPIACVFMRKDLTAAAGEP